jgi:hypothetical protein
MTLVRSILIALAVLIPASWTIARAADEKPAAEKKEEKKEKKDKKEDKKEKEKK